MIFDIYWAFQLNYEKNIYIYIYIYRTKLGLFLLYFNRGRQHSFVEIDHELFSTVILSLPLIQEGQLSVSGERMCTILVNS